MNAPLRTLADKAMLVRLTRSMFIPSVTDRAITTDVENTTGIKQGGRYVKKLLKDSTYFAAAQQAWFALYDYHTKNTLPWKDAGPRLLPGNLYFEYTAEMRALRANCDAALRDLNRNWYNEVQADMQRLGGMANRDDYPFDITSCWGHELTFEPVPSAGDFRVAIDDADRQAYANALAQAEQGMATHIIAELLEPLRAAAERLSVPIGEKGAVFRDSLIDNICEVVERLPRLDITGDPNVAAALQTTRTLIEGYRSAHDILRESPVTRSAAAQKIQAQVDALMKQFGGAL